LSGRPRHHEATLSFLRINPRAAAISTSSADSYFAAATRIVVDALTEQVPRCLTASVYSATVAQVRRLVDGLDGETCLAWANEIAPDTVPNFAAWAYPERPE
jgi:hypothetical protein